MPKLRRPTVLELVLYGGAPLLALYMLFVMVLLALRVESLREGLDLLGAFCTGAGVTSFAYSFLTRRALRENNDAWFDGARSIVKTTMVRLQRLGAVHPDFDVSRMPGKIDEKMLSAEFDFVFGHETPPPPPGTKLN